MTLFGAVLALIGLWLMEAGFCFANESEAFCGARTISEALTKAYWKKNSESQRPYSSCKFIHARYNCSRFGLTSSANYKIAFRSQPMACSIPSDHDALASVMRRLTRPMNVVMLGDSHMMQVFQSYLCTAQSVVVDIDAFMAFSDKIGSAFQHVIFNNYDEAGDCHAVKYRDYKKYYLASETSRAGRCQLSHSPGQTSCFKVPIDESLVETVNDRRFSTICASYVRPFIGMQAVIAGLDEGLSNVGLSLSNIDTILVNPYISAADLGLYLFKSSYQGKVLVIPRYPTARQTGYRYTSPNIEEKVTVSTSNDTSIVSYCNAMDSFITPKNPSRSAHKNSRISIICTKLDFSLLIAQRSKDAKASIYPFTYFDKKLKKRVTCQESDESSKDCADKNYQVCSNEALPCGDETHFCLPGPTDDIALLVMAAAISHDDYIP